MHLTALWIKQLFEMKKGNEEGTQVVSVTLYFRPSVTSLTLNGFGGEKKQTNAKRGNE